MDILKTYRIDKQLADDIKRLAKYYGSARRVLEISVGMLDKSSDSTIDLGEFAAKVANMPDAKLHHKLLVGMLRGADEPLASLDAVAEPGKAKVSFERERKPLLKPSERKK
jgi:hypothetical protein